MKNIIITFTLLFSVLFTVAQSTEPSPRVIFGDLKHDGPYDRSEILLQEKVTVSSDDGSNYTITKYRLIISTKEGKALSYEGKSNKLSAQMQGALNQIEVGDRIIIESVFASKDGDEETLVKLKPIVLRVKEFKSDGPYAAASGVNNSVKIDESLKATFGDIADFSTRHTLADILKQDQILIKSEDGREFTVTKFKLIAVPKEGAPSMASSSGHKLTEPMHKMIAKLVTGDRIIIEAISAQTDADGKIIKSNVSPIIVTVL